MCRITITALALIILFSSCKKDETCYTCRGLKKVAGKEYVVVGSENKFCGTEKEKAAHIEANKHTDNGIEYYTFCQ